MALAIKDGFKFFKAKNDVILCAGMGPEGQLPPKYFSQVMFRQNGKLVPVTPRNYQYLLVLDFEANCIENGSLPCQEIIEFPVVPIDLDTMGPACEPFHFYVKPTVVPELTEFCTELTGITQAQVNQGITIDKCLQALDDWIIQNGFTLENSTFITCGMWDLKTCLRAEAAFKKLHIQPYLKKFINIKDIWMHTLFKSKSVGMPGMLSSVDLELEGKHHSGIDDSKNIARIAIELVKRGGAFTQFQEILIKDKDQISMEKKASKDAKKAEKQAVKKLKNGNPLNG